MTWLLYAWLCTAQGECRPTPPQPFPTRGACLRAEREDKQAGQLIAVHCHHRVETPVS